MHHETEMSDSYEKMLANVPRNALRVAPSSIPKAGLGLFAVRDYKKGEVVTFYEGEIIDHKEARRREDRGIDTHIRVHIALRFYIDGFHTDASDPLVGKASFINHKRTGANVDFGFADSASNKAKMESFLRGGAFALDPKQRKTFVFALRDIKAGEEFFVDYGRDYGLDDDEVDE